MKYIVERGQLASIASAIREKRGLNLYDPVANRAYVRPNTQYRMSKYITFDGVKGYVGGHSYYTADGEIISMEDGDIFPTPSAGERRVDLGTFTTPSNCAYIVNEPSGLPEDKIQLVLGSSWTSYNAFVPIVFPDGFISEIENI